MTVTTRFERNVTIKRDPAAIHAELTDPQRQIGLQPFLISVSEIEAGEFGATRLFESVEAIRIFGGMKWKNRIRVCIDSIRPDEVIAFEARSFPGIVMHSRFTLSQVEAGTLVREEVRLDAPFFLHRFVFSQALHAQEKLLANLKRRLEVRSETG